MRPQRMALNLLKVLPMYAVAADRYNAELLVMFVTFERASYDLI